jgi:hypothetical protein
MLSDTLNRLGRNSKLCSMIQTTRSTADTCTSSSLARDDPDCRSRLRYRPMDAAMQTIAPRMRQ